MQARALELVQLLGVGFESQAADYPLFRSTYRSLLSSVRLFAVPLQVLARSICVAFPLAGSSFSTRRRHLAAVL